MIQLAYRTIGDETHPAIMFLHGFMGRGDDWETTALQFADDYFCIVPDLPGHGDTQLSTDPGEYSMSATAQSVVDVLTRLGIDRATLVGYSMGGRIALYVALEYPERANGLVLESASPGLSTERERADRIEIDEGRAFRLASDGIDRFVDEWYEMQLFESLKNHPDALAVIKEKRKQNSVDGLSRCLRGVGTGAQPSLWQRLSECTMPALLLCGEYDEKFIEINRAMSESMDHSKLRIVSGAGHLVHVEQPSDYCGAVSDFVGENIQDFQEIRNHVSS